MDCSSRLLPYEKTGMFSRLVLDYLSGRESLQPRYAHQPNLAGLKEAIVSRQSFDTDRNLVREVFGELYGSNCSPEQQANIDKLVSSGTFTVCTAHQPNIFTGYLYFVYKILHTISLSRYLKEQLPEYDFVPVYYMGSEDNDLEELGQVKVDGVKLVWNTRQRGAVGRMKVDKELLLLIAQLEGQLGVHPYGAELVQMLREAYQPDVTIAEATFRLVNMLFASYGLLVLIADDARLKQKMQQVFLDDLFTHVPGQLVEGAGQELGQEYKVQVHPREINLFYMGEGLRNRIVGEQGGFRIDETTKRFTAAEMRAELAEHPERFSPNVVLRALYQESILPNIAFIGGGAELAYWLEMKDLFDHYKVPYPVLVLRNSFLVSRHSQEEKLRSFGFSVEDLFLSEFDLVNQYVQARSGNNLGVREEEDCARELFDGFRLKAAAVDHTLVQHLDALHTRLQKQIKEAGKKLLRAEKRKFETQQRQLLKLKHELFPGGGLQERVENFMPFYAQHGRSFIEQLYQHSPALDQEFIILTLRDAQ